VIARRARLVVSLGACVSGATCAAPARPAVERAATGDVVPAPRRPAVGELPVRIALATAAASPGIGATVPWRITTVDGRLVADGRADERWRVERQGRSIRAVRPDGAVTPWSGSSLVVRPTGAGYVTFEGKRYRGELMLHPLDSGVVVVNHTRMDDYLKGVVPLEIGRTRQDAERAAVEAQAVAARSYAFTRLASAGSRFWDLRGSVLDQAYGGVDAETPLASRAVDATAGLVLRFGGRAVDAPYHAVCGGTTAAGSEVWRTGDQSYLRSVSDRIPGTNDRYWCDASPRFRWTATLERPALNAVVSRYLSAYAAVPAGGPGAVRGVAVTSRTSSGRVGTLALTTERGSYALRGNEIRFVMRTPGSEILASTYFSPDVTMGADGRVERVTLRGGGNGHGVGMCQWGAIGRARAGHDFRRILEAYYSGATVGPAY